MTLSNLASAGDKTACRRSNVRRACGPMPPATRLPSGPLPVSPAVNSTLDGLTLTPGLKPRPLSTTTEQGAVGVERRQFLLISSAEVDQAAAAQYQNVLKEQSPKGNLNKDPQQVERVRAIAKRLIPQTAVFRKDAVDWKWEVNV